jgi:putative membrane protein
MKLLIRILVTSLLVMIIAYLMKGVVVDEFTTALTVAIVLGLLNFFVKPILILFTLPVTVLTLGLFLLVINAVMIMLCDHFVDGFEVDSFWTALFFSIILSLSQSLVFKLTKEGVTTD